MTWRGSAQTCTAASQPPLSTWRSRTSDEVLVYGYHDPFMTPNFLRRNEVGVYVDGRSVREAGLV